MLLIFVVIPHSCLSSFSQYLKFLSPDRAGHGRRGRPLGSVGRRKLLENNQEALTAELRCELTKPLTSETEARIEMIKHKLQVGLCWLVS